MGLPIINGSNTTKIQALTDILLSIALEEAAIAHILNAEGEKIQRIVRDRESTTEEMLNVNQSVDNVADTLTNLVMLLKSKMRLVLNDKCYTNFCDDLCAGFRFVLTATNGTITPTPLTPNHYDLAVNVGAASATVTITTVPAVAVTITNVIGVGVNAVAAANVITITPNPTFVGTVTATLTLPNGCTRNITIHVTQAVEIPCEDYVLDLDPTNGILTVNLNGTYSLVVPNPALIPTILVSTIPNSTVTIPLSDIDILGDLNVGVNNNNTLVITSPGGTFLGIISATVNFGTGCSSTININVSQSSTPSDCDAISLTATAGAGGSLTVLGGTNHYQWTLVEGGTGNTVTLGTNTVGVNVTAISIIHDTVTDVPDNVSVTTTPTTITITKPAGHPISSGVLKLAVTYGNGCETFMQFNVQTLA